MNCFLVNNPKCCWDDVVTWGLQNLKGKSFGLVLCKAQLGSNHVSVSYLVSEKCQIPCWPN